MPYRHIHVIAVRRDRPDIERLARTLIHLLRELPPERVEQLRAAARKEVDDGTS
jgi:hypothetical protein